MVVRVEVWAVRGAQKKNIPAALPLVLDRSHRAVLRPVPARVLAEVRNLREARARRALALVRRRRRLLPLHARHHPLLELRLRHVAELRQPVRLVAGRSHARHRRLERRKALRLLSLAAVHLVELLLLELERNLVLRHRRGSHRALKRDGTQKHGLQLVWTCVFGSARGVVNTLPTAKGLCYFSFFSVFFRSPGEGDVGMMRNVAWAVVFLLFSR